MTLRLSDLSPMQIRLIIRLDDGFPHMDSVGRRASELPDWAAPVTPELIRLGLVELIAGWRGVEWVRLTVAGSKIREEGRIG